MEVIVVTGWRTDAQNRDLDRPIVTDSLIANTVYLSILVKVTRYLRSDVLLCIVGVSKVRMNLLTSNNVFVRR